jgi:8-oxo-dGTP pyrophosphatase MutT (NUDIX family)
MRLIENIARVLIVKDGYVLLARSLGKDGTPRHAFLPGGHIEPGERAEETLKRELIEEVGIDSLRVGRFLAAQENIYPYEGETSHEINLIFEGSFEDMNPEHTPVSKEGHIRYEWQRLDALDKVNLKPEALVEWIPQWAKGARAGVFVKVLK